MSNIQSHNGASGAVTIRRATLGDEAALERLSQLDSLPVPTDPVLVAEVDGQIRAAVGVYGSEAIADPFAHTAHLIRMLREQASGQTATSQARRTPVHAPRHRRAPWPA
jgi:hypothetical protein